MEDEILAARLGPMLEKYLLKVIVIEVRSEISITFKAGGIG